MSERDELIQRYQKAQHAMQAGVKFEIGGVPGRAVSERVGVNTAMCDQAALIKLLISKGVITDEEYLGAIAEEMEAEQTRYEARLGVKLV